MVYVPLVVPSVVPSTGNIPSQEMIFIPRGIVPMGSERVHRLWDNCKRRLVETDAFYVAPTPITVGLQKQVMGRVNDEVPNNYPALFSFEDNEEFVRKLSLQTGEPYGIGDGTEWERAARNFIPNVREWMEQHHLKTIAQLCEWLNEDGGYLKDFVALDKGELLTLGAELLTDPWDPEFQKTLEKAALISCWTAYGTASGSLNHEEAFYNQPERGPVRYGKPNQNGLFDVTGGIWEWCADVYEREDDRDSICAPRDPFAGGFAPMDDPRVLHGGSYDASDPGKLKVTYRYSVHPMNKFENLGARLFRAA